MSGSTDWNAYDVPAIWSMVKDFDTEPQWRHLAGWDKACRLTDLHLSRMKQYRDELAAAWPPEQNEASGVYLAEFDRLVSSVQATYDAAVSNHLAMAVATGVITEARDKLKPVYDEWQARASTMASYEASMAASAGTLAAGLPAPAPGPPPLPPNWRDALNAQARDVMNAASSEITAAAYRLVTPPGYTAPIAKQDPGRERDLSSSTPFAHPSVPAVAPRSPARAARSHESLPATPSLNRPQPPAVGRTSVPDVGDRLRAPAIGPVRIAPSTATLEQVISPPTRERASASGRSASTRPATGSRQPPVHGVIGPHPASPAATSSQVHQPAMPFGGVVGSNAAAGRPGPSPSSGGRPQGTAIAGYRSPDGHLITVARRPTRSVPDDHWPTYQGVPPVISPSADLPDHSPGPAIGLTR